MPRAVSEERNHGDGGPEMFLQPKAVGVSPSIDRRIISSSSCNMTISQAADILVDSSGASTEFTG